MIEDARRHLRPSSPVFVFACALILRLVFVVEDASSPFFEHRLADAADYANLAAAFTKGTWPGPEAFFRPPLYPLLLGLLFKVLGTGVMPQLVVQAIVGAATCVLVLRLAQAVLGEGRAATVAALACACSGALVYFDGEPLSGSLDAFLFVLSVHLLHRAARRQKVAWWAAAGAAIGLAATNRGGALLLIPVALWWTWKRRDPAGPPVWKTGGALLAAAAVLVAPVAWHDARYDERPEHYYTHGFQPPERAADAPADAVARLASGQVAPLGWADGVNLYVGNDPDLAAVNHVLHTQHFERFQVLMAEPFAHGVTTASGHSRYFRDKTKAYVASHPGAWLKLVGRKALELVNGAEVPRGSVPYAHRRYSLVLAALLWKKGLAFPDGLVIPLGLLGIWLARDRLREHGLLVAAIGAQAIFVLAFFVTARYRLPMIPLLAIFAGVSVDRAAAWAAARPRPAPPRAPIALGAALIAISNLPVVDVPSRHGAYEHYNLANELYDAHDLPGSITHFRAAIAVDPTHVGAHNNLAWALRAAGQLPEAEAEVREALRLDPAHTKAWNNLAIVLADEGRPDEALAAYAEALRLDPGYARARYNMALLLRARGRTAEAARELEETARLLPNWPDAHLALADLRLAAGDAPAAVAEVRRAVALRPRDGRLHLRLAQVLEQAGQHEEAQREAEAAARLGGVGAAP
jgi:tetratricopeptide (TPR) repeat protein